MKQEICSKICTKLFDAIFFIQSTVQKQIDMYTRLFDKALSISS